MSPPSSLLLGARLGFSRAGAMTYAALAGTVSVTTGSRDLLGTGTTFTSLSAGQILAIAFDFDGWEIGAIATIPDDTHLTLSAPWSGPAGVNLAVSIQTNALAGPALKPASNIPANWPALGSLLSGEYARHAKYDDILAAPDGRGAYELVDQLYAGSKPTFKAVLGEVNDLAWESIFGSGPITDAVPFAPLAGDGQLIGWWQVRAYSGNTLALNVEQYGSGKLAPWKIENHPQRPALEIAFWSNPLATGIHFLTSGH